MVSLSIKSVYAGWGSSSIGYNFSTPMEACEAYLPIYINAHNVVTVVFDGLSVSGRDADCDTQYKKSDGRDRDGNINVYYESPYIEQKSAGSPCPGDGNPCNPASGNKYQNETDFVSKGLVFRRSYNSKYNVSIKGTEGFIFNQLNQHPQQHHKSPATAWPF